MKQSVRTLCVCLVSVATLSLAACGEGGGPTSPSAPTNTVPTVTGTYAGTLNLVLPELRESVSCPVSTTVAQNGQSINIAPMLAGGACGGVSIPFPPSQIDQTGALAFQPSWTSTAACGTYTWTGGGGFFGRELRMTMNATSNTCWNINASFTLSR